MYFSLPFLSESVTLSFTVSLMEVCQQNKTVQLLSLSCHQANPTRYEKATLSWSFMTIVERFMDAIISKTFFCQSRRWKKSKIVYEVHNWSLKCSNTGWMLPKTLLGSVLCFNTPQNYNRTYTILIMSVWYARKVKEYMIYSCHMTFSR